MSQAGVLAALLPDARFDAVAVSRLVALQQQVAAAGGIEPEVWPRLALLFSPAEAGPHKPEQADAVADRLKLSNAQRLRSEEHTSELQSLMRNSYDVFCLKKKKQHK